MVEVHDSPKHRRRPHSRLKDCPMASRQMERHAYFGNIGALTERFDDATASDVLQ